LIQFTLLALWAAAIATAHPLGNFTINHYTRLETSADRVRLRYVVDYAEIAAFQELQTADADSDGTFSEAEKSAWLARVLPQWLSGLRLTANGQPLALRVVSQSLTLPPGAANLPTLRVECELEAPFDVSDTRLTLSDTNHAERQGWHEIVLRPGAGVTIFDSTAFGDGVTDELKAYPEDRLMAPLDERVAQWSATTGDLPAGAKPLLTRDRKPVMQTHNRFAGLFTARRLAPVLALIVALIAFALVCFRPRRIFSRS
jgi:hypothetical protein